MARQTPAEKFNRALERQLSTPKALLIAAELEEGLATGATPLPSFTRALRDIPRERFKEGLLRSLERRAKMATSTSAAPEARASATPYLSVRNAVAALEFYKK